MADLMYTEVIDLLTCKAEADNRLIVSWDNDELEPELLVVDLTPEQINDIAFKYREIAEILMKCEK